MNQNNFIGIALEELYRIFDILNEKFYEEKLLYPMITVQKAKRAGNLGWFSLDKVWQSRNTEDKRHEINICAEYLSRDTYEIVGTLHHEAVHLSNRINEIKDCSGQVHNKKFKKLAESVGLIVEKSKQYGFGHTTCSAELMTFIDEVIKPNMDCFEYFRSMPMEVGADGKEGKDGKEPSEKKTVKYICPQCGEIVKAKRDKNIICGECEVPFEMEE